MRTFPASVGGRSSVRSIDFYWQCLGHETNKVGGNGDLLGGPFQSNLRVPRGRAERDPSAQRACGKRAGAKGGWVLFGGGVLGRRSEAKIATTEHGGGEAVHDLLSLHV